MDAAGHPNTKKNVLIIHPGPLGNHTGTYYYCLLLKDRYNVTYLGINEGKGFKTVEGIRQVHLEWESNPIKRKLNYFKLVAKYVKAEKFSFILVNYFPFCSLFHLFTRQSMVAEIRTSYIFESRVKRFFYNVFLSAETRLFKGVVTLSEGLKRYLWLPARTQVIPLGGPLFEKMTKNFDDLSFMYVGTFHKRNIDKTIDAFKLFSDAVPAGTKLAYHVIGFGSEADTEKIKARITDQKLEQQVFFHGAIRYPALTKYFELCNVGIAFIPMEKYFETQPPTKTFEYLLSGMPVIATATGENKLVVNATNGALTDDTVEGMTAAFEHIYMHRNSYDSGLIQKASYKYSWDYIVNFILVPYIEKFNNRNVR